MKVVGNLYTYKAEKRAWRDKKVKKKTIEVGDLVLRSPLRHQRQNVVTIMECQQPSLFLYLAHHGKSARSHKL
jgi:hypothetical protein